MNNKIQNIVINFDFGEVNRAVFRNAQIYLYKKNINNKKITVITLDEFKYLFSNADYLAVINKEWFNISYRTVLEYLDDRQKKYYVDSGLEEKCVNKLHEYLPEFEYIRVNDYFDVSNFQTTKCDLTNWLKLQFNNLKQMILNKSLYMNFIDEESLLAKMQVNGIKRYLNYNGPKIIIRTRDFKNKAIVHNSKFPIFYNMAKKLIKKEIFILNLGCPLLSLNIENELYFEYDHNMTFEEELALCEHANACVMTAEAGLFTGFAASNINIIQIDGEWSEGHHLIKVSLFDTRKKIGIEDIDIRRFVTKNNFSGAVDFLCKKLGNLKRISFASRKNQLPDVLYL
ncbi:hypothetical protein GM661_06805 [Iocasia frigidifontis]|uniref:Uncharacterized protein n=1 Tax=Iocasia fonsfrigidae TaxID=2682810 RepID=A0A8A7KCA9_9FIRM|nr:hypothetical protein [Iocasia fonsfrigidae]QTL97715.1 hypothetical protein GM661_06805 [Iocasia fonsfrigidae]